MSTENDKVFFETRGSYEVILLRNSSALASSEIGMFKCSISDVGNVFQHFYVGIYPSGIGKFTASAQMQVRMLLLCIILNTKHRR